MVADSITFSKLTILVAEHNIEAENMYDTDETGFVMGMHNHGVLLRLFAIPGTRTEDYFRQTSQY